VYESWERDRNDQANIWQVYTSTNICQLNQSWERYDSYSLGPLTTHNYWRICQVHLSWEHCVAGVSFRAVTIQQIPATWHHCWLKPFLQLIMKDPSPTSHISVKCTSLTTTPPTCRVLWAISHGTQSLVTRGSMKTVNTRLSGRYARQNLAS
jgi:hypothetical protein